MKKIKSMLAVAALLLLAAVTPSRASEGCSLVVAVDNAAYFAAGGTATLIVNGNHYNISAPTSFGMGDWDMLLFTPAPSWQCINGAVVAHTTFWQCGKAGSPVPVTLPSCISVTYQSLLHCNCPFPGWLTWNVINETPCSTGGN